MPTADSTLQITMFRIKSRNIWNLEELKLYLVGGIEFLKTLPNLQFARGWRDLPLAWLWAEQQVWAWWRLQSTLRQLSW